MTLFRIQMTMAGQMYGAGQKQKLLALLAKRKNTKMGTYWVKSMVEFCGEVEADSKEEAEDKGWFYDNLEYAGVYSLDVDLVFEEDEEDE